MGKDVHTSGAVHALLLSAGLPASWQHVSLGVSNLEAGDGLFASSFRKTRRLQNSSISEGKSEFNGNGSIPGK